MAGSRVLESPYPHHLQCFIQEPIKHFRGYRKKRWITEVMDEINDFCGAFTVHLGSTIEGKNILNKRFHSMAQDTLSSFWEEYEKLRIVTRMNIFQSIVDILSHSPRRTYQAHA